jgi:hypothetical protein
MAIHTSAITYRRGISNNCNNFFFVAQTNNTIPVPMSSYLRHFRFSMRNYKNPTKDVWPWSH